ncbi:MAG: hypothetical protein A2V93_06240 [Ignavibacteria bacterium RBG_16_34_14]|nr:MAG: hypothetical protein A2V93_06240 [Ignavibacteria bacterium RBG_16_34_14]
MTNEKQFEIEISTDSKEVPQRLAIIPERTPVKYELEKPDEKLVMTFPNLIIREVICFQLVVIVLALISLFFDAPLEELANLQNTPNPAKAPWYFLGLQELLHIFPPVVAGVLIPLLVLIALIVIPYFDINIKRSGLWNDQPKKTFVIFSSSIFLFFLLMIFFDAFSIAIPTLLIYILAVSPYFIKKENVFINALAHLSLAEWIMTWFVFVSVLLIIIGTYFRGPGWNWVWP